MDTSLVVVFIIAALVGFAWPEVARLMRWARRAVQMGGYHTRVWLARRWCDPQLAWLAEQYGSVLVTSERFGKVVVPVYRVLGYDVGVELAQRVDALTRERDFWRRKVCSHRQTIAIVGGIECLVCDAQKPHDGVWGRP